MFSEMAEPIRDISSSLSLILRVGSSRYRVIAAPGSEVVPCPALASVPNAPYWLLGIGLHKNEAIPVVHLQALLEEQLRDTTRAARVLVLRGAARALGFLVDDVDPDDAARDTQLQIAELDLLSVGHVLMASAFLPVERSEY